MHIGLDASTTLQNVEDLRVALLAGIESGETITVDASAVVEADLSLVQLLEAARFHVSNLPGRDTVPDLNLSGPVNPVLRGLLEEAGFLTDADAGTFRFWLHEEGAR